MKTLKILILIPLMVGGIVAISSMPDPISANEQLTVSKENITITTTGHEYRYPDVTILYLSEQKNFTTLDDANKWIRSIDDRVFRVFHDHFTDSLGVENFKNLAISDPEFGPLISPLAEDMRKNATENKINSVIDGNKTIFTAQAREFYSVNHPPDDLDRMINATQSDPVLHNEGVTVVPMHAYSEFWWHDTLAHSATDGLKEAAKQAKERIEINHKHLGNIVTFTVVPLQGSPKLYPTDAVNTFYSNVTVTFEARNYHTP